MSTTQEASNMAASSVAEQLTDGDQTLDELIDQKVEEKVEQRVAEETAELRQELQAEKTRNRMLERALAETEREVDAVDSKAVTQTTLNNLVQALTGADIDDYTADPMRNQQCLASFGDQIRDMGDTVARHESIIEEEGTASGNSKEAAWQDTIEAAENLHGKADHTIGDNWVKLFTDNIEQATGYTNRRAGQLIDEWSEEKEGTEKVPYKRYTTSRKTESSSVQRKALKIDLDVWGNGE